MKRRFKKQSRQQQSLRKKGFREKKKGKLQMRWQSNFKGFKLKLKLVLKGKERKSDFA